MELEDTPIRHLVDFGLCVRLEKGRIMVGPKRLITPELASYIRANRPALVAALAPRRDTSIIADFAAWEARAADEFMISLEA